MLQLMFATRIENYGPTIQEGRFRQDEMVKTRHDQLHRVERRVQPAPAPTGRARRGRRFSRGGPPPRAPPPW
ncbi:hypothetical protein DAERI_020214 [Deinococcus aerius]|uniref:Uncharacterized protein n=1 Tax=Deinococcus aerius TaxID=200253 RepID=A0A2I9DQS7_9DEIO|nr:hypothetical protein DAERI_020214 [Deinococcus aerius]GMA17856.1 hypothetical protein GCM10025871_41870 [Deinococcus metallilatus]